MWDRLDLFLRSPLATFEAGIKNWPASGYRFDVDDTSEAPEVCSVEREQAPNAVFEHRRDDVGVVDLTAAAAMGSDGKFDFVRKYGVKTGSQTRFWSVW